LKEGLINPFNLIDWASNVNCLLTVVSSRLCTQSPALRASVPFSPISGDGWFWLGTAQLGLPGVRAGLQFTPLGYTCCQWLVCCLSSSPCKMFAPRRHLPFAPLHRCLFRTSTSSLSKRIAGRRRVRPILTNFRLPLTLRGSGFGSSLPSRLDSEILGCACVRSLAHGSPHHPSSGRADLVASRDRCPAEQSASPSFW